MCFFLIVVLFSSNKNLPFVKWLNWKKTWNFFAAGHGKDAVDGTERTLKRDPNTTILSENIVIKNIDSLYDIASALPSKINILKCTKKQIVASVHQINIDTQGISSIHHAQKKHTVNVISPFTIEIKEHFYAGIHTQHTFIVLEDIHNDSHNQTQVMSEQNVTNKNIKDIKPGKWILVQYKGYYFLGIVLVVSCRIPMNFRLIVTYNNKQKLQSWGNK